MKLPISLSHSDCLTSVFTAKQVLENEANVAQNQGVEMFSLMCKAGEAAFQQLVSSWPAAKNLLVVCGKGNNGGDGFVVATLAQKSGLDVKVLMLCDEHELAGDALKAFKQMKHAAVSYSYENDNQHLIDSIQAYQGDVIVDAIFGIGFRGALSNILKKANLFSTFYWPNFSEIKIILALGIPIALSLLFEVSLFSVVAIILVPFGAEIVASHQIALNFTALIFMVPLSIAMAATIKVGFAVGENNLKEAKNYCSYAIILGLILALFTAFITVVFRHHIAGVYSTENAVVELAASLILLSTLYQFSDTIQVVSAGALRGYKDTKSILYITLVSYWFVGLTVGVVLGITDWIVPKMGPYGFWIGFIVGLTTAAILLSWRLRVIQKRFELST